MNLWWLDLETGTKWSPYEQRARMAIYGLFIPIFLVIYGIEMLAANCLGIDDRVSALIGLFSAVPAGLYTSRRLSVRLWPDLMRKADENAAVRLGRPLRAQIKTKNREKWGVWIGLMGAGLIGLLAASHVLGARARWCIDGAAFVGLVVLAIVARRRRARATKS
jgi:hypothetical protein